MDNIDRKQYLKLWLSRTLREHDNRLFHRISEDQVSKITDEILNAINETNGFLEYEINVDKLVDFKLNTINLPFRNSDDLVRMANIYESIYNDNLRRDYFVVSDEYATARYCKDIEKTLRAAAEVLRKKEDEEAARKRKEEEEKKEREEYERLKKKFEGN